MFKKLISTLIATVMVLSSAQISLAADNTNVMVFEKIEDLLDFLDTKGHSLDTLGSFSKIVNKNKNKEEKNINNDLFDSIIYFYR